MQAMAAQTDLFTGADLENLCHEAALHALRERMEAATAVEGRHFAAAMAAAQPSLSLSQVQKCQRFVLASRAT